MESSSESDSPLWNDGADSSERGATGAPNRSSSACGALKRHKVSIVMTLVASVVFYLLGAGPAGRAALKLKLRGVRWGSQNMEDVTLMKMFFSKMKTPGTFVEMGALDGVIFSNSIAYEETYGWSGVLIEANPVSCEKLFKEPRRARSTKFCSAVCDDAKKRFLEFEFVDDPAVGGAVEALKTMDAEWKESWHSAGAAKKRSMVPCAPLSMLLRSTGVTAIDLFSLDVWKGTVTSIDELEMHGAVDVAFPAGDGHAAWEARVECRRIQQIITDGRVVRGEPGWSIASMLPLLEKSKLAKLGTPKKGKKKAKKGKKARASNGGSGQRVANGGNAATPEQRLYAALLLISKKMHAIECNGGKKRNIGLRDVEIGVIDTLRTHDWKVSRTQLLAWVAELKGLEAKAGVHDEAPTGLGLRMGRPMDLSPAVVVDIIQFFLHPGGGTSSHPNEQNFVIELKKRHHKQYTDAGYAPLQYEGMRKPLVRKYVKIIETFFRPGPAVKERSKMRQIQMTSMINAINEFIMAETLQRIFPGHYVAKELLFNYDPTTLVYNLLKRSKGMGLSLFPAGFDLPVKAPIASKGGAAKLSHALKMHIITMALGREGPTFLEVKIPPGARAGIVGADAAPIVVQIMGWNRARRAAMPVFLLATFPSSAQGVKESESESDSAAEQLFRDYIWPKFFEWIQETRDSMDCPERHHPEYADDHEIWKYAALTLDSSAPECKGILKWFATTEGKESNIGAGKIGAGATGPFQSNDASKLFPAIK